MDGLDGPDEGLMTDIDDEKPRIVSPGPTDLTIAICTIGRDGYLQAAIESLFKTTPSEVTLRVVLNAPADPSLENSVSELLLKWDGPTEIITLADRLSIAGSHNTALGATTTDYVTFMGDDDLVLEPRVDRLLSLFADIEPTPAVVGSYCRRVSGSHDDPRFSTNKDYGPATLAEWRRLRDSGELIEIVFPSAIYRTDLLAEIGGFEERFGSAMDLATFTRLGLDHPVLADPRRTFAHRVHDGSVTSSSPSQHATRLRYTRECIDALRAGRPEPSWDEFLEADGSRSSIERMRAERRNMSATLFRQGGAAVASGSRLAGIGKVLSSAALSPGTFYKRSRSQVKREAAGEPVVAILVKNTNHYRVPFYETLREDLAKRHIELRMIVADGLDEDEARGDQADLGWAEARPLHELSVGGRTLLWQPGFDVASGADLVITEQASKQLFNIALSLGQRVLHTRHAFWGHGKNFQASIEQDSGAALKQRLTGRAHWFFAYNEASARAAIAAGMPSDRVTSVMTSTDTDNIRRVLDALPADNAVTVRGELGMGDGPVGVFMGGIYPPKRPEFILDAVQEIRALVPDFEFLAIGGGSQQSLFDDAAAKHHWIHSMGPIYSNERIRLASIGSVALMPGKVGLNVVDAFALGLPTITTDIDYHSPEIDYLKDGGNGIVVRNNPTAAEYAQGVARVLGDATLRARLRTAAMVSGRELSIDDMSERFANGVVAALETPAR